MVPLHRVPLDGLEICASKTPNLPVEDSTASTKHQPRPILGSVPPLLRSKIGALTEVQFVRGNLHLITALAEDGAQGDR